MAELSDSSMLSQYQLVDMTRLDVVRPITGELTVLLVFLMGVWSFITTKSDASISSAIFRQRESGCSSESHRALCALTSPDINASVFVSR